MTETTESLCPHCLQTIPAQRIQEGNEVYLEKTCPDHGSFRVILWRGSNPAWESWRRPKAPAKLEHFFTARQRGCPHDCGLCPEHRTKACSVLLEVTQQCNAQCPVCFADAGADSANDPTLKQIEAWFQRIWLAAGPCNIQLSGGEPTLREDLPEIISAGRAQGFSFFQLNTNGLRLAEDPDYLRRLKKAGLSTVFLQFDGVTDDIYLALRGQPMLAAKRKAIEHCGQVGLGVVLVPTVAPQINLESLGEIIRFACDQMPTVRGVHFQPISYFGRFPQGPKDSDRVTLPEILQALEYQTRGEMKGEHFRPPGYEHSRCSFNGHYYLRPDGHLQPLSGTPSSCCSPLEKSETDLRRVVDVMARRWSAVEPKELTCCQGEAATTGNAFDQFLKRARTHTLAVSGMAFQDVWNLDLERLRDCCIQVMSPDGRLIPFCAYNLTDAQGNGLYR